MNLKFDQFPLAYIVRPEGFCVVVVNVGRGVLLNSDDVLGWYKRRPFFIKRGI